MHTNPSSSTETNYFKQAYSRSSYYYAARGSGILHCSRGYVEYFSTQSPAYDDFLDKLFSYQYYLDENAASYPSGLRYECCLSSSDDSSCFSECDENPEAEKRLETEAWKDIGRYDDGMDGYLDEFALQDGSPAGG